MRKPGWYWVKWENPGDPPSWCPSWWCEDAHAWWVEECYQEEDDIVEIGPRIPTPDEPWQCVPGLDGDETKALERFSDTTLDDGTYDIGRDMIRRLADKGAVRHLSAGRYQLTQAGQAMLAAANPKEVRNEPEHTAF